MAQANVKAVITADDRASSTIAGVGTSFGKLSASMAVGQLAANAITKAFDIMKDTIKSSVAAAFEQVRSVENATIALRAYEKDGNKVNQVLKDLISYARSDLGVLFQREDLFAAAQTLKLYGQTTETLVDKVKILSKGVSLGKTSFQELSSIVGRAAAKGRLDAVDFDMLIERGIGLDKSFRGATVTSEQLFAALDKALPAELLRGRANTIDGLMIRLKSAFRDVGSAILGVNTETSQFIQGGLGDQFMGWIRSLTTYLQSPEFKNALNTIVTWLSTNLPIAVKYVTETLLPNLINIFKEIWPAIQIVLEWLGKFIGFLADHEQALWVFIGVIAAMKAMFAMEKVVSAFQVSMGLMQGSYTATSAILSTPIPIVIAIGAALVALALVRQAAIDTWREIDKTNQAIAGAKSAKQDALDRLARIYSDPTRSQADRDRAFKQSQGLLADKSFAVGGFTGRGGSNEVAGIVHKGEYVLPQSMVDQTTGKPKVGGAINISINAGAYMGNQQDARRYAQQIADALKDIAKMNGTSVGSMLA